ncbi:MAG: HypC/HybG/HupF family hydrogenase formation chaperone [Planctomycetota bacterium]
MCLAVPGRVESIDEASGLRTGQVRFGGVAREVVLEYVPEAQVGDYVLVHVGFALSRVDEQEARRTLALLEELGELAEGEP